MRIEEAAGHGEAEILSGAELVTLFEGGGDGYESYGARVMTHVMQETGDGDRTNETMVSKGAEVLDEKGRPIGVTYYLTTLGRQHPEAINLILSFAEMEPDYTPNSDYMRLRALIHGAINFYLPPKAGDDKG